MESADAAPISNPTRPNTPTTSEYGSQAASGETTPTNHDRVTSFAKVVQSVLAEVQQSEQQSGQPEEGTPYDPEFPTPMEEDLVADDNPRYNLRNAHRAQQPIPSDSEGSTKETSRNERVEALARQAFKEKQRNPYRWTNPLLAGKNHTSNSRGGKRLRKRIKSMTAKESFKEQVIWGKAGPPPSLSPSRRTT